MIDENEYRDFFTDKEMVFYKNISDLSEKILKISSDEKLRKKLLNKAKKVYEIYSDLVSRYIIDKTLDRKLNNNYFWNK